MSFMLFLMVYEIILNNLNDFEDFIDTISEYI